ncbi:unnamed protein product, partial [Allacma fusca]
IQSGATTRFYHFSTKWKISMEPMKTQVYMVKGVL